MMVMTARLVEMLLTMVLVEDRGAFVAVIVGVMLVIVGMAVIMIMVAFAFVIVIVIVIVTMTMTVMIMVAFISMRMVMGAEAYRPVSVDQVEGSQQCHPDAG